jgi:hypothetical protein
MFCGGKERKILGWCEQAVVCGATGENMPIMNKNSRTGDAARERLITSRYPLLGSYTPSNLEEKYPEIVEPI